jgi:hypothetical protein
MNKTVAQIAKSYIKGGDIKEGMLLTELNMA